MNRGARLLALALCLGALPEGAIAVDKNGVSPNVISLPSGPGSIEGLGESFQPMLNTGTARYAVRIPLPKLHNTPELKLQYESGFGDGPAGIGWVYGPGSIARQVDKGLPRYVEGPNGLDDDADGQIDEVDETDTYVGPDGEELVPVGGGVYRARIEGGFARYRKLPAGWEVTLRNGTRVDFGTTASGRAADVAGARVYRWLPERSTDTKGNVIEYRWESYPGSESQKYLREIRYGPAAPPWGTFYFASFAYEDKPDWRADYRSGFLVRTAKRLAKIEVGIQGTLPPQCAAGDWNGDGTPDALITRYEIAYDPAHPGRSFLAKVTRYGADGVNWLPPISFAYSHGDPPRTLSAAAAVVDSENAPPTVMDSELVELVDLNRDALPDILRTDLYGGSHTAYLNLGEVERSGDRIVRWSPARVVESADGLAPELHLAEKRVHLADMSGDGIADLVHTTQGGEVQYFPNRGDVSWGARGRMSLGATAPPAPFDAHDAKTSDLDFDKRADVVQSSPAGYAVWFNYEDGRYSREVRTPGARHAGRVILLSDPGVDFADMNGDRLPDVVQVKPTKIVVAHGMGRGHFAPGVEIPIPDTALTDGTGGQVGRAKLTDVDGDGLDDLVVERAVAGECWVWPNTGTDALSRRIIVTGMPAPEGQDVAVRWADLNGNGTTDLVYADSDAYGRLRAVDLGALIGGPIPPNLLVHIDNGLGAATTIEYRSSTAFALDAAAAGSPWRLTVPFPMHVVSAVTTSAGLDLDEVPGIDAYRRHFEYRDGFYEDRERAFRGFERTAARQLGDATAPTRVSVSEFYTGGPDGADNDGDDQVDEVSPRRHREEDALKGMVRALQTQDEAGKVFTREEGSWRIETLLVGTDGVEVRHARRTRGETLIFEGSGTPQETLRTDYTYDEWGNITAERKHGALSIAGDEAFTFTEHINDAARWLIGLPRRLRLTDAAGTICSESFTYYDGPDYVGLPFGQAERGKVTRTLGRVREGVYANLARNAYDAWGNVVGTLDPNGNRRTITWDDILHKFPVREEIEVGGGKPALAMTAGYNLGLGTATESYDFNNNRATFGSDAFGRVTSIALPGDIYFYPTQEFSYVLTDPVAGVTYRYDPAGALALEHGPAGPNAVSTRMREAFMRPGTFDSIAYSNGLGRKLGAVSEAEAGFVWKEALLLNAHGEARRAYLPFATPSSPYIRPPAGGSSTELRYDAAGREVERVNPPDAVGAVTSSSVAHLPLRKVVTDENLVPKELLSDGLGRLIEVREHNGAETFTTRYAYDPAGRLVRIVDAQGNIKTFAYDNLGRKTLMEDPDRGRMEYEYDDAGNLVRTTDNKRQTVRYAYDGAGRLLAEYHLDGSGPGAAVEYHYDSPSPDYPVAVNQKGRLAWLADRSGGQFFSYDVRGNVAWSIRRIGSGAFARDYRTELEHDSLGRVVAETFPDGDRVTYEYNARTLLESIPGLVDAIDYHPSGGISSIVYGNGVATSYAYDPRQRLQSLRTDPPAGGPVALQDLAYSYDGVGNILGIADGRPVAPGDPSNATQAFRYDPLNRLTRAEGPGYGAIDYGYDAIGNKTFQGSPAAPDPQHIDDPLVNLGAISSGGAAGTSGRGARPPGSPPGPHAVTSTASGLAYGYDDNGNMTTRDGDTFKWDFRDRLVRAVTATADARYVYDHSGQRIVKRVLSGGVEKETLYATKGYEIREGKPVKYVFAGDRRIARVEGRLAQGPASGRQVLRFQPGWNFFSLEVEPANPAVEDILGPIAGKYDGLWTFDAATQSYVVPSELHGRRGYLIHATEEVSVGVGGSAAAGDVPLVAGWNLVPCPSENALPPGEAFAAASPQMVWGYDASRGGWLAWTPTGVPGISPLDIAQPGAAYWVRVNAAITLPFSAPSTTVFFYHPDHLGSTGLGTDTQGVVTERAEFYPFGRERYGQRTGQSSHYGYSGKEADLETGLLYYEARYLEASIGRFASVDPRESKGGDYITPSAAPWSYAYAGNNPLTYVDPDGRDYKSAMEKMKKENPEIEKSIQTGQSWLEFRKALARIQSEGGKVVEKLDIGEVTFTAEPGEGIGVEAYTPEGVLHKQVYYLPEEDVFAHVSAEVEAQSSKGKDVPKDVLQRAIGELFVDYYKKHYTTPPVVAPEIADPELVPIPGKMRRPRPAKPKAPAQAREETYGEACLEELPFATPEAVGSTGSGWDWAVDH